MSAFGLRSRKVGIALLFFLAVALSLNAFTYFNFDGNYGFLRLKREAIATGWYLPAFYSHVLIAGMVLVIGFFQFSTSLRHRSPGLHRTLGKIYVFGILFFSAPGGFVMSLFINRGSLVLLSFFVQCTLWFWFTYLAYHKIRKRDITSHREWMIRSFALTLAAITLRVYVFASSWSFDLSQPAAYATIAWLSWLPNLILAELYIRKVRVE
ncbi:MAG: DUF2306 domain-containing protein [Cyclobacteriaceae bacterium]|nr:DUF2306 domain-containing protein [Cyclobacteriaceae bacterium]